MKRIFAITIMFCVFLGVHLSLLSQTFSNATFNGNAEVVGSGEIGYSVTITNTSKTQAGQANSTLTH